MYRFSNNSIKKLNTVNEDLQVLMYKTLEESPIDFGISYGIRTREEQFKLYKKGRVEQNSKWVIDDRSEVVTNCDGINTQSKHQSGNAVDIYAFVDNKANWDKEYLEIIANIVLKIAKKENIKIKWGGHFNGTFKDYPHFELIN